MQQAARFLGATALLLALGATSLAQAQSPPRMARGTLGVLATRPTPAAQGCAWPFIVDADTLNLAYPDPNATYWAMPFQLTAGETIELQGEYPSARFMAVTLYDLEGDTVAQLSDYEIAPDPGSANPYAEADPPASSSVRWQLEVVGDGTTTAAANQIVVPAGQRAGWLVYRVYLGNPAGDLAGGAPLPTIVRRRGATTLRTLAPCPTFLPGTTIASALTSSLPEPVVVETGPPSFVRLASTGGLFANEANAYLTAFSDAGPGTILVVSGKLPTAPDTGAGQSVVGDFELRYFSITSNLNQQPYPTVDGVYDAELPLDDAGYYTVIVARDDDVPHNATAANGVAVLRWGDGPSQAVIVRNMLPASTFPSAVQDVTPSTYGAPSDAATVMSDFYPRIVPCAKQTFASAGAAGCFAAAE